MTTHPHEPVTFGQPPLRIEDVLAVANRQAPSRLQDDAEYRERIAKGAQQGFDQAKGGECHGDTVEKGQRVGA